jgi:hypothetical protein
VNLTPVAAFDRAARSVSRAGAGVSRWQLYALGASLGVDAARAERLDVTSVVPRLFLTGAVLYADESRVV